jgi:hypothetical protein
MKFPDPAELSINVLLGFFRVDSGMSDTIEAQSSAGVNTSPVSPILSSDLSMSDPTFSLCLFFLDIKRDKILTQ